MGELSLPLDAALISPTSDALFRSVGHRREESSHSLSTLRWPRAPSLVWVFMHPVEASCSDRACTGEVPAPTGGLGPCLALPTPQEAEVHLAGANLIETESRLLDARGGVKGGDDGQRIQTSSSKMNKLWGLV